MAPKKKKAGKAPAEAPAETEEEALKRFIKEYKARCDAAYTAPNADIIKMIQDPEEGPKHLQWLVLNKIRMTAPNFEALMMTAATMYTNVVAVKNLTVWGCGLGDEGVQKLAPMLLRLPPSEYPTNPLPAVVLQGQELTRLDFIQDGVTAQGCKFLTEALRASNFLQRLSLAYNPIGDEGVAALVEGLTTRGDMQEGMLQVLDLEGCGIGAPGIDSIVTLVTNAKCVLNELNLKGNYQAGMEAIGKLLAASKTSTTLATLNLHDTFKKSPAEHQDDFRSSLKEVLLGHPTLSALDFTGNAIASEEGNILYAALQMNRNLVSLKVDRDLGEIFAQINLLCEENMAAKLKASKGGKKKKK